MAGKYKDIQNMTFNRLTAIKPVGKNKFGSYIWLFQCSCGKQKEMIGSPVIQGAVRSCGCYLSDIKRISAKIMGSKMNKGFEVSAIHSKYSGYKHGAIKRNLVFELTLDNFKKLIKGNCFYCDSEPKLTRSNGRNEVTMNGIDRIDNSKGYILNNCVSCCKICNSNKSSVTLQIIKKVYEHLKLDKL